MANVLRQGSSAADPFWRVDIAGEGQLTELVVHVIDCGSSTYCTAKVNSQGCLPAIGGSGTPSLGGPDDFHITATNLINAQSGLVIWSLAPGNTPALGGTLCVSSPIVRRAVHGTGGSAPPAVDCSGTLDDHFTQAEFVAAGLGAGTTAFAQIWYRDHLSSDHAGLTDGLRFTICP